GKPFILLLNSARPYSESVQQLRAELAEKYDVPVIALSVATMVEEDILGVLREALYEFPVHEVNVNLPSWVMVLDENHWLRQEFEKSVRETVKDIRRLRDVDRVVGNFVDYDFIENASLADMDLGKGLADIDLYA